MFVDTSCNFEFRNNKIQKPEIWKYNKKDSLNSRRPHQSEDQISHIEILLSLNVENLKHCTKSPGKVLQEDQQDR